MSQYVITTPEGRRFGPTDFPTLVQWAREGRIAPGMNVQDLLSGQTMLASSVPGLFDNGGEPVQYAQYTRQVEQPETNYSLAAIIIGGFGMIAWCIPILGIPTGLIAIFLGARSLRSKDRLKAIIAIIFGVTCVLLSVVNILVSAAVMKSMGL